ncbi:MAG: haloacid dehalogenase type II [Cellvibrionaceae bacterium]
MKKTIKALCFDVFGTVTDWRGSVIQEAIEITGQLGVDVPWGEFVDKWRKDGYVDSLLKISSGEMDYISTQKIHMKKLRLLLSDYNIDSLSELEVNHLNLAWNRILAWPDSLEGLQMMKDDFLIMPFSNGDFRCLLDIAKHNRLPWDAIISADFFKKVKPDISIYDDAAKMLCLEPEEIMMVACHAQDLDAARKAGFRTAYVNRPLEFGAGVAQEVKSETYDFDAHDFVDLAAMLRVAKLKGEI